jgi:hypothetical protein
LFAKHAQQAAPDAIPLGSKPSFCWLMLQAFDRAAVVSYRKTGVSTAPPTLDSHKIGKFSTFLPFARGNKVVGNRIRRYWFCEKIIFPDFPWKK